jgi:mRNA interferase YafQ
VIKLKFHKEFQKQFRKINISEKQFEKFVCYICSLLKGEKLPSEARDHKLKGEWQDFREFHLGGDLIVIYKRGKNELILVAIGTHNQLFKT